MKPTYHFLPRHWDETAIKERLLEFIESLSSNTPIHSYLDGTPADCYRSREYFKTFYNKPIELVRLNLINLYSVEGYDGYNNLRGICEFKFRVHGQIIHSSEITHSCLVELSRRGDAEGLQWKIAKVLWHDDGIDVSDVTITQLDPPATGEKICIMDTSRGQINIRLFPEQAPLAVQNWIELCQQGYYDNTGFPRIIKDFVIQGGALDGSGHESESSFGGYFKDEVHKGLYNFNGALCLGNTGPNTNGNQFYIVQRAFVLSEQLTRISLPLNVEEKYREVGGLPELDGRYTVFGQVYEGMDIVESAESSELTIYSIYLHI